MYKMKHSVLTVTYVMETFIALEWVKHRYKGSFLRSIWTTTRENMSLGFVNSKDADQPVICAVWSASLVFVYQNIS